MCKEWDEYEAFRDWALSSGYSVGRVLMMLDRRRNFFPNNCRWTNAKMKMRNSDYKRMIDFDGQILNLVAWSEKTGISQSTLHYRLGKLGWSVEDALTRPVRACSRQIA